MAKKIAKKKILAGKNKKSARNKESKTSGGEKKIAAKKKILTKSPHRFISNHLESPRSSEHASCNWQLPVYRGRASVIIAIKCDMREKEAKRARRKSIVDGDEF